ncbi:MAG: right-handed parallel beta-helix repeat-containing protein [Actinoplanes sp.]
MTTTLLVAPDQPGAYQTIGDALQDVEPGGVVTVAPGTYYEALFTNDRPVVLVAAEGPGTVVIDARAGAFAAVSCSRTRLELRDLTIMAAGEPAVAVTEGANLTLTGCTLSTKTGTAIRVTDRSEFAISRCAVTGGHSGLSVAESRGTVDDSRFSDLTHDGVIFRLGSSGTVSRSAMTRCGGAGIYVADRALPVFEDCTVSHTGLSGVVVRAGGMPTLNRLRVTDTPRAAVTFEADTAGVVDELTSADTAEPAVEVGPGSQVAQGSVRRPPQIVAAALLMIPAAVTWVVAGIAWMVVTSRLEGDALFLFWIIALAILALCLFVAFMCVAGIRYAWRGGPKVLTIPAGFTMGLFVIAIITLIVQRKLEYKPTMLTPLIVGGLAAVALGMLNSKPADRWFAVGTIRRGLELHRKRAAAQPVAKPTG